MALIKSENFLQRKLKGFFFKCFNYLENNNNADFYSNGERMFIESFFKERAHSEVTIFDIGANTGAYIEILINLASKYSVQYKIHAFEPVKASFEILKSKFQNNSNIILNNFGLSNEEGEQIIYLNKQGSSLASLYLRDLKQYNILMDLKETVRLKRLDMYLANLNVKRIDLLKADVEGHELFVFKGMGQYLNPDFVKNIQFEYGGANVDSKVFLKDIFQILNMQGFQICKIMKRSLVQKNYSGYLENFQYSNYVATS